MAELTVIEQVRNEVDEHRSFLVEAGAGSGKTHTLIQTLRHLLDHRRKDYQRDHRRIVCITYTNVAKDEIIERLADPIVEVRTIHEFLWSVIEPYQDALHAGVTEMYKPRRPEDPETVPPGVSIQYVERGRYLAEGKISHDDVLALAHRLVTASPKLKRVIADRFPVILVDEYQDTAKSTVELLLDHVAGAGHTTCVIGLFGDSMQKIYQKGIGAVSRDWLTRIPKHENYRSSEAVIALLNKMRPELPQHSAGASWEGETHLLLLRDTPAEQRLDAAYEVLRASGWKPEKAKHLLLTHRSIAGTLKYGTLLALFTRIRRRDDLLDGSNPYAAYLLEIESLCTAYTVNDHATLSHILGDRTSMIKRHEDKARIGRTMDDLLRLRSTGTIGQVIAHADATLLPRPSKVQTPKQAAAVTEPNDRDLQKADFVRELWEINYSEVAALAEYRNKHTPFTTQHGVKGDEFDDVLVIIDDKAWSLYNMNEMLANPQLEKDRVDRSRNLFYVCCSRARQRLAVLFLTDLSDSAERTARDWFSAGTVHA